MLILPLNSVCVGSSTPPKIVFNRLNGKRYHSAATHQTADVAEGFTPAHEENVRFVYEGKGQTVGRDEAQRSGLHDLLTRTRRQNVISNVATVSEQLLLVVALRCQRQVLRW